jgi:two-component system, LytTR family, sensor kinase
LTAHDFIFSNRPFFRVSRHLAFWLAIPLTTTALTVAFNPTLTYNFDGSVGFVIGLFWPMIIPTYITLYVFIPRYLVRKKYRAFFFALFVLSVLFPIFVFLDPVYYLTHPTDYFNDGDRSALFDGVYTVRDRKVIKLYQMYVWWRMVQYCGFATVIKLMKFYYLENSENKCLHDLKVNHEIQLLKSQLNSRFLLKALQSIQRHVRNGSGAASGLLLKLSDLLSYVLYENDEKFVPLQNEIAMIEKYLTLENEGVGNTVKVTHQGEMDEMKIVPLLLLPLVESCFENSAVGQRNGRSVSIDFNLDSRLLSVTLTINDLQNVSTELFQKSIRIKNVRQRLTSYYAGKHDMEVSEKNQKQIIHLRLTL